MDSPQALSIVYEAAAEELRVFDPLNLQFASPPPYDCTYFIAATTSVTGISIASKLQDDTDEVMALRACGRALANAVQYAAASPADEVRIFKNAIRALTLAYCTIAQESVVPRQIVSVAAAVASASEQLDDWPRRMCLTPWP